MNEKGKEMRIVRRTRCRRLLSTKSRKAGGGGIRHFFVSRQMERLRIVESNWADSETATVSFTNPNIDVWIHVDLVLELDIKFQLKAQGGLARL